MCLGLWVTDYSLIVVRNFSVILQFTRDITKLLWQRSQNNEQVKLTNVSVI